MFNRRDFLKIAGAGGLADSALSRAAAQRGSSRERRVDVCVYGATASGLLAAFAASRSGCSVLVAEPSRWLGGIVGGGIRIERDCLFQNFDDVGGMTGALLREELSWKLPNPHTGQNKLRDLWKREVKARAINVVYEHRLRSIVKQGGRITSLILEVAPPDPEGCPIPRALSDDLLQVHASVFIDASYEGDVMAMAKVKYATGRESSAQYHESLAGIRNFRQFPGIDPFVKSGDRSSGLLWPISPESPGQIGEASRYCMTYNFRPLWTRDGTGVPMLEPNPFEPEKYELLRRSNYQIVWPHDNFLRTSWLSGGVPGLQADYQDGNWETRSKIWRAFLEHNKHLTKLMKKEVLLPVEEYPDTRGWPHQFYIRTTRRMMGRYVMTQADLAHQTKIADPIALAYYPVDIYPCRLTVMEDGVLASEGETWELVAPGPIPIPYRAITPKREECENLLVPVCMSASHLAYADIRFEPMYMMMGESAGIAAAQAFKNKQAVQAIDISRLTKSLLDAKQVLAWNGKGYGSDALIYGQKMKPTWWERHPEDYEKNPPRS